MENNNAPIEKLRGPKVQELSLMARKIQQRDYEWLTNTVNANPRLLVTDMDTPTIVQEGFRYNALHVAARWDNEISAKFILSSVSNQTFLKRIYTEDSEPVHKRRLKFLTDMYLNTPEKGASETPLHFACKFNSYKVVKILTSHPMCNLTSKNRYGETPFELIGTRGGKQDQEIIDKIKKCFTDLYLVPIWRDPTNSVQPSVGKPILPKQLGINMPKYFTENIPEIDMFLYEIHTDSLAKPKSEIEREIRAFAGPTSLEKAEKLYNFLKKSGCGPPQRPLMINTSQNNQEQLTPTGKTPPSGYFKSSFSIIFSPLSPFMSPKNASNRLRENNNQLNKSPFSHSPSLMTPNRPTPEEMNIRVRDIEKGIEIIGRKFTKRFDIPWFEYWEFKKGFVNFSDPIALQEFDAYLEKKELEHAMKENLKKNQDVAEDLNNTLGSLYDKFESLNLDSFTEESFVENLLMENSINKGFSMTPSKFLNISKGELTPEIRKEILGKEDAQLSLLFNSLKSVIPLAEYSSISRWFQVEEPKISKRTIKPKRLELDFD